MFDCRGRRIPAIQRFWWRVRKERFGCWLWVGGISNKGYGVISVNGRGMGAHVFSYLIHGGQIPPGYALDHLCRTRSCVNPKHLEPVTLGENVLRGVSFTAENARKTHCPRGHAYSEGNTAIYGGSRVCRECSRLKTKRVRERKKENFLLDIFCVLAVMTDSQTTGQAQTPKGQ